MNEFETIDDYANDSQFSDNFKGHSKTIGQWVKINCIYEFWIQGLGLIISFTTNTFSAGDIIGIGITVALNIVLLKFGQNMEALSQDGSIHTFKEAMRNQKSYWVFVGILVILRLYYP